jgi:hypothetical protein
MLMGELKLSSIAAALDREPSSIAREVPSTAEKERPQDPVCTDGLLESIDAQRLTDW